MNILYVANIRLPTEKAHGAAIMKMCGAFAEAGVSVRLVVARRFTKLTEEPFALYNVRRGFSIAYLPVIDLFPVSWIKRSTAFSVESATFYLSLFWWLLPRSRRQLVYTREIRVVGVARALGFRVAYECHGMTHRRGFYFLARRAHRVIVIAESQRRDFVDAGVPDERIFTAPSGVDIELFLASSKADARAALGLPDSQFIAVYTGGFTTMGADKGIYAVFDAVALAPRVYFVGVGARPEELEQYRKEADARGIGSRVTLVGYVPQRDVARYQAAADALLMPYPKSHYQHHLSPIKLFEYAASSRPIVGSDVPTVREVLGDESALLVPPGDAPALARALERVRTDPKLADDLSRRAQALSGQYSWSARARRILDALA